MWEGLLATPFVVTSIPGGFIIAALLTQWLGIEKTTFGWIVSLPFWSNALQILLLPAVTRLMSSKDLALGMGWFNAGLWAMFVAVLGFLPRNNSPGTTSFLVVFFSLASLSSAFVTVGWTAWFRDYVPGRIRSPYIGKRNSWISMVTLAFLGLTMILFEANPGSLRPYVWIIGGGVAFRCLSLLWQHSIRTVHDATPPASPGLLASLRVCHHKPGLLLFIGFSAWENFWMSFTGPFGSVFCFEELHTTPGTLAILTTIATVAGVFGWGYWGRVTERTGTLWVIVIGGILWEAQNILWAVLTPSNTWLLYPMFLWGGFFSVAFFLGCFNLLLNLVPEKSSLAAISIHLAATAAASALASILAGYLTEEFVVRRGGGISSYHLGFALKSVAFFFGLLLLIGIREPSRTSRTTLPGAFRALRQTLTAQGLDVFSNLVPLRIWRRKK
jgi:hypothetical protein